MTAAETSLLLTDLYQLTMLDSYWRRGMVEPAVFECHVRALPARCGFLVAAGLQQVVAYLETLRATPEELEWVAGTGRFDRRFIDRLARRRGRHARGHARLRRRADPACDRAAAGGTADREPSPESAAPADAGRDAGGALPDRRSRPAARRLRAAAGARRRGGPARRTSRV